MIRKAHERALAEGFVATDDAALIEWCGAPVAMIEGSKRNLKITTPADLTLANAILAERQKTQEQVS